MASLAAAADVEGDRHELRRSPRVGKKLSEVQPRQPQRATLSTPAASRTLLEVWRSLGVQALVRRGRGIANVMERRERIGHLLRSAETSVALALQSLQHGEIRMADVREYAKKARKALKQAVESIDGVN